jgi:hypothetical protein
MNTKSIYIDHSTHANYADLTTQPVSIIAALCNKVSAFFVRSELAKAQAEYQVKQQRQSTHRHPQNMVNSLPVEEKLRLGMYHLMD